MQCQGSVKTIFRKNLHSYGTMFNVIEIAREGYSRDRPVFLAERKTHADKLVHRTLYRAKSDVKQ